MSSRQQFLIGLGLVAIVSTFVMFWHLGRAPLENWDEGIYADMAQTMHHGGSWWLPMKADKLYFNKPPLSLWLMNASFSVFGVNEFAVRFWPAVAGVLTTMLITVWVWQALSRHTLLAKSEKDSIWLAILAGLLFISGRFVFFHAFHSGDTDGLLLFFTTASLYAYWRTWTDQRWWWVVGLMSGLAIMTKSFIGLLPQVIQDIDLIVSGRVRTIQWRRALIGLGALLIVVVPWHLAVILSHGAEFWHQVIAFNVVERTSSLIASVNEPWYWYAQVFRDFFFPASVLIGWGILAAATRRSEYKDISRLLLIWLVVPLVAFSLAKTKFDHYIQPVYPAAAMVIALGWVSGLHEKPRRWRWVAFEASVVWMIALMPSHLAHSGALWKLTPYGWLPASWFSQSWSKWLVALITVSIVVAIARAIRKDSAPRIVAGAAAVYIVIMSFGWQFSYLKHQPASSPLKELAAITGQLGIGDVQMVNLTHFSEPAGYFYLHRAHVRTSESTTATDLFIIRRIDVGPVVSGYDSVVVKGRYELAQKSQGMTTVPSP